jgi:xylulokinase
MSDSEKKYILAIDHGTQGPKSALVSTRGEVVEWAFQEVTVYLEKGGGAEQDPEEWWNAILKTSKQVIDKGTVSIAVIVVICDRS